METQYPKKRKANIEEAQEQPKKKCKSSTDDAGSSKSGGRDGSASGPTWGKAVVKGKSGRPPGARA
jgi:hypothetical protein